MRGIISSHILSELSEFCDTVGIMEKGHIVMSGDVQEIGSKVMGKQKVVMKLLSDPTACVDLLNTITDVNTVTTNGYDVSFIFDGDDNNLAELLTIVTSKGVKVLSFGKQQADLESIFLQVGAKEVS